MTTDIAKSEIIFRMTNYDPALMNEFISWLDEELNLRGWNDSNLAKRAKLSQSVISKARSGIRPIKWEACISIADALKMPPEIVLRKAGLLPENTSQQSNPEIDELAHLFQQLSADDRKHILSIARTFLPKHK